MLKFSLSRSKKKGVRVYVFRRNSVVEDTKKRYEHEQLGTFLLDEGCPNELVEKLTHEEANQLETYLAEIDFAKQFQVEPDALDGFVKISLRIPKPLYELKEHYLDPAAKQATVWFNMSRILLEHYRNAVESTARKIAKIQGENSELINQLQAVGLSLEPKRTESKYQGRLDLEGRVLFKALLQLKQPIIQTCQELEACAKQYGKDKKFFPSLLKEWAGEILGKAPKEMKKWHFAVAIEVLLKHSINPLTLLSADKVATYWAYSQVEHYGLAEAQSNFIKTFKVPEDDQAVVNEAIERIYKNLR